MGNFYKQTNIDLKDREKQEMKKIRRIKRNLLNKSIKQNVMGNKQDIIISKLI